ncbi:MAG: T9SS type A sorting domain-containing protein [Rhodothermales bacterium]|nr:T9SS type A sorting domain-containing protein [Rhodothermales bacterium]
MPFNIAVNDADGLTRETQMVWSLKGNVTSQWWNTPNQWPVVAMVGSDFGVANEELDDVATDFTVHQNYPNPFSKTTSIRFALDSTSDVTLRVYDILGRVVATPIAEQTMGEGEHVVKFDARTLASGQYLYRLEAGSSSQSRRMLVVK